MEGRQKTLAPALRISQKDAYFDRLVTARSDFFVDCRTVSEQVSLLQNVLRSENHEDILEFLCVLLLAANTSETAALRRAVSGALRKIRPEIVAPLIWQRLSYLMDENPDTTACVNELVALCAWQPHGVLVMVQNQNDVFKYLERAIKSLLSVQGCQRREQAFDRASKIIRCTTALAKFTNRRVSTEQTATIRTFLLHDDNTLPNRLACGISLAEVLLLGKDDPEEVYKAELRDLLPDPLAHVCFIAGIINVTPLNTGQENFLSFYGELLTELSRLSSLEEFHKRPPYALTCSRTVIQWTEKLLNFKDTTSSMLDERYETLLRLASLNAEHYVDAVQHQGRALMFLVFDALAQSPEKKYAEFLRSTFERLLREPHHKKSKYTPLTIIAEHVELKAFIHQTMIREMYEALSEKSMFPYVQDFVRDVGKAHLKQSPSDWEDIWLTPFFDVFDRGTAPIIENLIPVLLKLYPSLADKFVDNSQHRQVNFLALKLLPLEKLIDHHFIIDEAQWSIDEKIRLNLVHVLTDCPKSCEPLNPRVIVHLQVFLRLNSSTQNQALRQAMFSSFKKLIHRMHESDVFWKKAGKVHPVYGEDIPRVLERQEEFVAWMFNFCVGELRPGCNFFTRSTILMLLELLSPHVTTKWTVSTAATLLQCIKDTYESNKTAVLKILETIPKNLLPYTTEQTDQTVPEDWVAQCVTLTRSARPPDCVTAAYMLRVIAAASSAGDKLKIIETMSRELSSQIDVANNQGLVEASSGGPMYGALTCLRTLLSDYLMAPIPSELVPKYRKLFKKLVEQCRAIATIASPLVTNASPEGQLQLDEHPELEQEFKQALNKGFGKNLDNADSVKACAVASQMLLLCCWRSHKEVSLTFGGLATHLNRLTEQEILPKSEFVEMGTFFMDELCTVRHRGAFEQAYVGFSSLCGALWRSSDPELNKLPLSWLNELVEKIRDGVVSSTRRSAGLPFIVQAVVVTEPEINNCQALKQAMTALLPLAESESSEVARVHALNVLRVLFKDTRLGDTIVAHVSRGMMTALEGFDHPVWGVRNSCTLLFSSLITRIFGVNRSKQDVERKNCLTGHMFFLRFPELFDFLLCRLSMLLQTQTRHPGLFPILLLLGRLFPSLDDTKLRVFVNLLDSCCSSPMISIRKAGAKAFATFLPAGKQSSLFSKKMEFYKRLDAQKNTPNAKHGFLLQCQAVLKLPTCTEEAKAVIEEQLSGPEMFLGTRSSVIAALYLELLMRLKIRKPEFSKLQLSEFTAEGHTELQRNFIRYKCELGVVRLSDIVSDHHKMGVLEWSLENTIVLPEIMTAVLLDPEAEHPDVQKLAFDLAARELHETSKDQLESFIDTFLSKLPSVALPTVAVSVFCCIATHVVRLPVNFAVSTVEVLRQYSAANQDPAMRSVASDLARKLLEAHGRLLFEQSNASGVFPALCEALINLVVDNDVYVRNQIVAGISSITTEHLRKDTPLDSLLALCSEMCEKKEEFVKLLVELAVSSEEAPLDVEFDEQPFEKGELNTFHDSLVIAESCRQAVVNMGGSRVEIDESRFEAVKSKVAAASVCDLAFNRQLDADLVKLGQYYTMISMREGRLHTQDACAVRNAYFDRFKSK